MFFFSDSQGSLFQVSNLLTDEKRSQLEQDWPGQFRDHVLPLIDEAQFRDLYCANNGRPNKPIRTIISIIVLKEMFNLSPVAVRR